MSYKFNLTRKDEYIYGSASGEDSYQTTLEIFKEIVKACDEYECYNILVVSEMTPATILEAFNIQTLVKEAGITLKHKLAWVDKNPESLEINKFAATVLVNRSLVDGKVFSDVENAKQWLLER